MATILLVRHAQNDWVKKGRLAGWLPDVHLNETGQQQATAVAARLAHLPLKAVYSSPLARCRETATVIAGSLGLDVIPLEAVGEVRFGQWEGKKVKKLARERSWSLVQFFPSRFRFPGGESFAEVQARAMLALDALSAQHGDEMIAVVSHADVIKLLLANYLGLHLDLFQRLAIMPASVSVVQLPAGGPARVLRLNDDGPLAVPPVPGGKKHKQKSKP